MRRILIWAAGAAVTVLTLIACTGAASACHIMFTIGRSAKAST